MRRTKAARLRPEAQAGALVLIGNAGVSMPDDWWLARILWRDGEDILTEHAPPSGIPPRYRQVLHIDQVRAVGTIAELGDFKERCRKAVKRRADRVRACERALGAARDAVWRQLDELAAGRSLRG